MLCNPVYKLKADHHLKRVGLGLVVRVQFEANLIAERVGNVCIGYLAEDVLAQNHSLVLHY